MKESWRSEESQSTRLHSLFGPLLGLGRMLSGFVYYCLWNVSTGPSFLPSKMLVCDVLKSYWSMRLNHDDNNGFVGRRKKEVRGTTKHFGMETPSVLIWPVYLDCLSNYVYLGL